MHPDGGVLRIFFLLGQSQGFFGKKEKKKRKEKNWPLLNVNSGICAIIVLRDEAVFS